jgi:glycosyltransferase involved in cell wall biosynthesis
VDIGYDGLTITEGPAGVGTFALRLLLALADHPSGPRITAALPRRSAADGPLATRAGVEVVRAPVDGPDTPRALLWQHARMPRLLRRAGARVHVAPAFVVPALLRAVPSVVVIHDLAWVRHPRSKSARFRVYMNRVVPASAGAAARVLVPSEFTAGEVRDWLPALPADRVTVLRPGTPAPGIPPDAAARVRALGLTGPFVLSVSNFDPRKNLPRLVEAWRLLRREGSPLSLVLVGDGDRAAALRAACGAEDEAGLVTPGRVDDATRDALYAGASVVAVPSLYEGFGFPVVEAFAAGAPGACARAASLPEVAGDAAVLFDPEDPADIARGLREAATPGADRERRVRAGRERAAALTWENCADALLGILRACASPGRP